MHLLHRQAGKHDAFHSDSNGLSISRATAEEVGYNKNGSKFEVLANGDNILSVNLQGETRSCVRNSNASIESWPGFEMRGIIKARPHPNLLLQEKE